ncbi:MAG: YIP1 family protein [Clostridia bacterium]|nr:YIP1 family protein [Clostridia bacterium]
MRKKNIFKVFASMCLATILVVSVFATNIFAATYNTTMAGTEEFPYETYTYWSGLGSKSKTMVYCKPMYEPKTVIDSSAIGTNLFGSVDDVCTDDGYTYILDSTSSKIYVLDKGYNLSVEINQIIYKEETLSIVGASGIFVKDGKIYIADTKNARILVIDNKGTVIHYLTLPESKLIPSDFKYSPQKIAVDSRDYLYISSDGSYYGALVYSPTMEFLGFYGANTVAVSVGDAIKNLINKIFTTDEKRAASVRALPYQFTDFVVGPSDFVYTVTSTSGTETPKGQVKRLNPGGKDVLGKEDENFADESNKLPKPESLKSIDVDKNGFFYVLESGLCNRVFWYDNESNLICVFGGRAGTQSQVGTVALGGAIAVNGTDVVVSDPVNKNVTVYSITDYGNLVRNVQLDTLNDDFEQTVDNWNKVIKEDVNNQLAYRGLAQAYYTLGSYDEALEYSKLGADRETYANAFVKLRTKFLEKWFTVGVMGLAVIIVALVWLVHIKNKKGIVLIKNYKVKNMFSSVFHPFESFRLVKEKNMGSVVCATVLFVLFYITTALSDVISGYAFNRFDASSYNSFFVLLRTVALVALFVIANWLVCVLMGGIGKLKEIYIVTCYSLIPVIFATVTSVVLSHMLSPDEYVFVTIFSAICTAYTFIILAVGIMKVHDFEFGKFLGTTAVTVIAMLIIIFLIFLVFMLAQQVYGWIGTIFTEMKYR